MSSFAPSVTSVILPSLSNATTRNFLYSFCRTQADYVPAVVFPFVCAFGADDLGAFECSMTVLLHWSASWLVTFPQPPVPVLVMLEAMLRRHDSALAKHLRSCNADALVYGKRY
jgi:hypothetical protein